MCFYIIGHDCKSLISHHVISKPRFAKPLYGESCTGGSNPPLSAICIILNILLGYTLGDSGHSGWF